MVGVYLKINGLENLNYYTLKSLSDKHGEPVAKSIFALPDGQWLTVKSGPLTGKSVYRSDMFCLIGDRITKSIEKAPESSIVAGQPIESSPTEAQKHSGNYRKGHIVIDGLPITIENPVGFKRSGTSKSGKKWECELKADYGYILGSKGFDKDALDIFIKPGYNGGIDTVFIVNQVNQQGKFDEHKVMLGYPDAEAAKSAYMENYEPGWNGFGSIIPIPIDKFKKWSVSDAPKKGELMNSNINDDTLDKALSAVEQTLNIAEKAVNKIILLQQPPPQEPTMKTSKALSLYGKLFELLGDATDAYMFKAFGKELQEKNPGSHWITVSDESSPLHGRHMLIRGDGESGPDGKTPKLEILHGGSHSHWFQPEEHPRTKLVRNLKNVEKMLEQEGISNSDKVKLLNQKAKLKGELTKYDKKNTPKVGTFEEKSGQMSLLEPAPVQKEKVKAKQQSLPGFASIRDQQIHQLIGEKFNDKQIERASRDEDNQGQLEAAISREIEKLSGRGSNVQDYYGDQDSSIGESIKGELKDAAKKSEIAKWCMEIEPLEVSTIGVDPATFQFKTKVATDTGETDKLKDVREWDPAKAGTISVWQGADGKNWVANGHHRMELAKRLGVPWINAKIYKESDGYSKSDVRRLAAELNIAEGNAEIEDAVKYLRETGYTIDQMRAKGIAMTQGMARRAYHIAQLGDTAYKQFLSGDLSAKFAEAIGEFAKTDATQEMVLSMIKQKKLGFDSMTGDKFRQSLPGMLAYLEQTKNIKKIEGDQGSFSFLDDDEEFQRGMQVQNFVGDVSDQVRKKMIEIRRVVATSEKLSKGEKNDIAREHGVDITTDRDLEKVKNALKELEYRLDAANRYSDTEIKKVTDGIVARHTEEDKEKPIDKWHMTREDLRDFQRHFIDEYDNHNMMKTQSA